jgi:hypothetical protein
VIVSVEDARPVRAGARVGSGAPGALTIQILAGNTSKGTSNIEYTRFLILTS